MTVARSPGSAMLRGGREVDGIGADERVPPDHRAGRAIVGIVDDHDVREVGQVVAHRGDPFEVRGVLDDHDLRTRVVQEVSDLVFRRRVVDRDRRAPDEQHRDVGDVELGPVPEQHRHPCAASHAELGQRRRDPGRPVPVLGVRERAVLGTVLPAECDRVRVALDRGQEQAGDGLARHALVELCPGDRAADRAHGGVLSRFVDRPGPVAELSTDLGGEPVGKGGKVRQPGGYCHAVRPEESVGAPGATSTRELLYAASPRDVLLCGPAVARSRLGRHSGLNSLAQPADVPPMRPHARLPLRVAVLLLPALAVAGLVVGPSAVGLGTRPATAASAPVTDTTDPDTAEAYRALAIQVTRNNAMLAQLTTQLDATTQRLAELAAAIVDTQQKFDAARAEVGAVAADRA